LCVCLRAEKNVALQELQQQLTANHEAAIEAMKTAHCEEIESVKESLTAKTTVAGAFDVHTAALTNKQAAGTKKSASDSVDVVPRHVSLDLCSLRDLAALYHTKCQHAAWLQSKLDTVTEFIAYTDNLGKSADDLCNVTREDSPANILVAVRTFALGFRQNILSFPLQVENLQRLNKYNSRRKQFVVRKLGGETAELSFEVSHSYMSAAMVHDNEPSSSSEAKASVKLSECDQESRMDSRPCYSDSRPCYSDVEAASEVKEVDESTTGQLLSKIDELQTRLELDKTSWDAEVIKLTDCHTAALEAKDREVAELKAAVDSLKETHAELTSALQRKDEMICAANERHRTELASVMEKICKLESEHYRTVEEHRERIAEMEQSDVELNSQLIAVTEKFNSVTEYMTSAEQLMKDYESKVDRLSAELVSASTELLVKDAEIVALKEQMQLLQQPHTMPVANIMNSDSEVAAEINRDHSELPDSMHVSLHSETCRPNSTRLENVDALKLRQERFYVTGRFNEQQSRDATSSKEHKSRDATSSKEQQQSRDATSSKQQQSRDATSSKEHKSRDATSSKEQVIEELKCEHEAAIEYLQDLHSAKVLQLIKDFDAHEKELRETMNSDFGL